MEPHERIMAFVKALEELNDVALSVLSGDNPIRVDIFVQPKVWAKLPAEIHVEQTDKLWWNLGRYRLLKHLAPNVSVYIYADGVADQKEAA